MHRDDFGAKMGMWLFLFTEVLLFGGMFLVYTGYRFKYPDQFHLAAMELNTNYRNIEYIILITSSLTVAISITAIKKQQNLSVMLSTTITICGYVFNK